MTTTTENTVTAAALVAAAAAGLGRKVSTMTITTDTGKTRAVATDGAVWIDVVNATNEQPGEVGTVSPRPAASGCSADATLPGRSLRRIVAGIVPATDTETSRYALGGTLVEIAEGGMVHVVGTDGRRLHAAALQPSRIFGQHSAIVPAHAWKAIHAAARAALRAAGVKASKLVATIDRGDLRVFFGTHTPTGGTVISIWFSVDDVQVGAAALAVEGRFPKWRDCLPTSAAAAVDVNVPAAAAAVAEFAKLHTTADRAGRAAFKAAAAERKARRQPSGPAYAFARGVQVHAAGMIGRGVEWFSTVPGGPVAVILDHDYLGDALAAAAAFDADTVSVAGTDNISAVTITTAEYGEHFLAVIMPMAQD
jgi:hypothetical protein